MVTYTNTYEIRLEKRFSNLGCFNGKRILAAEKKSNTFPILLSRYSLSALKLTLESGMIQEPVLKPKLTRGRVALPGGDGTPS